MKTRALVRRRRYLVSHSPVRIAYALFAIGVVDSDGFTWRAMSIAIRLEKLRFIAQELELALRIAVAQPSDHYRRVFSRRVLIRAKDFAFQIREFRRPAERAGYDLSKIRQANEAYAKSFEEYYREQRDRLCGHVQDLDWLHRLELWTDIEALKVGYFADGARELYDRLGELGFPDYKPYSSFPELGDREFARALDEAASTVEPSPWLTLGVDILSATRPNAGLALNFHPLHQRGAQLAAIRDWIERGVDVESYVQRWTNARRICRAQIVTDVVSFADCLVTRGNAGVAQRLTGLDKLMIDAGFGVPTPVEEFVRVFRFAEALEKIRHVRDKVGAHLHRDPAVGLPSLLADLDDLPMIDLLRFYDKLWTVFATACRRDIRLRMYEWKDQQVYGAELAHGIEEHVKPFDERQPVPQCRRALGPPDLSDESIRRAIRDWVARDTDAEGALHLLRSAFASSRVVSHCERGGVTYEFRAAHEILLEQMEAAASPVAVQRLLALVSSCGSGWPIPLAEVLLRFICSLQRRGDSQHDGAIYRVLGELPTSQEAWIDDALIAGAHGAEPRSARLAIVSFYRRAMALRSGPPDRPSRRGIYMDRTAALVDSRPQSERLCIRLQLCSLFASGALTATQTEIDGEYPVVQSAAATELNSVLRDPERIQTASSFLRHHDYVSLAVLAAEELRINGDLLCSGALVEAVVSGEIAMPAGFEQRAQPLTNRAVALLQTERREEARQAAAVVMHSYPTAIGLKLRCLWILARAGHPTTECREMLDYLCRSYVFTTEQEKLATKVREGLSGPEQT